MHALRQAYLKARHLHAHVATGIEPPKPTPAPVVRFIPNVPYGQPKVLPKRKPVELGLENLRICRRAYDADYEHAWYRLMCGQAPSTRLLILQGDRIKLRQIRDAVCENYQINPQVFTSARRQYPYAEARQIAMLLANNNTDCSLPELGRWLGGRDHTTILHGIRSIEKKRLTDPDIAARIDLLSRRLGFTEACDVSA